MRSVSGTEEAEFRALYEAQFEPVYAYFARRVADRETVSDLVSNVFLVAWRRLAALPESAHERKLWLFGVARRVLADSRKAERRRVRLSDRLQNALVAVATPAWPQGRLVSDTEVRLAAALDGLRPADREALMLVAWDRLSEAEAAAVLGCSVNAFAIRIHRARKRLAARYAAIGPEAPERAPHPSPAPRTQGVPHD